MSWFDTPLYLHIRDFCADQNAEAEERQLGEEYVFAARTARGIEIEYSQKQLADGTNEESMVVRRGLMEKRHSFSFREQDGRFFTFSESSTGYSQAQYRQPTITVNQVIRKIFNESFANDFAGRFATIKDADCDSLYLLTDHDLIRLGGREFIEDVRRSGNLVEGLGEAYERYRPKMEWHRDVRDADDILALLPNQGKVALFTNEYKTALKIMRKAVIDIDAFNANRFFIGNLELKIGDHERFLKRFFDSILTPNILDYIAKFFSESKEEVLRSLSIASSSDAVKYREQMRRIEERILQNPERTIEDVIGIETFGFYQGTTSEFNLHTPHIIVYDEFTALRELKSTLGVHLAGTLDKVPPGTDSSDWKSDWVRKISRECVDARKHVDLLGDMDFNLLLYISAERHPSPFDHAYKHKRSGIGNLMIGVFDRETARRLASAGEYRNGYSNFLETDADKLWGYHFKGRILKPVLERIIDESVPEGGRIAVSTCGERVHELLRFCEPKKVGSGRLDSQTLLYRGREIVLVDSKHVVEIDEDRLRRKR